MLISLKVKNLQTSYNNNDTFDKTFFAFFPMKQKIYQQSIISEHKKAFNTNITD